MARAKRTDRTDARRRYRADQAASGVEPAAEAAEEALEATPPARRRGTAPSGAIPVAAIVARPSIGGSFKSAFRPIDLRGDLRALPKLILHWSVLVTAAVSIAATALFIIVTNEFGKSLDFTLSDPLAGRTVPGLTSISYLAISLFVTPPPAAGGFIIGFFAKRASWLTGLLFGALAALLYSVLVSTPAGRLLIGQNDPGYYIVQAWLIGPAGAMLFASAAAWYRRFLDLINPNRGQRRGSSGQPKPQQGRGNVKPNRLSR